jgi:general stress protein 26
MKRGNALLLILTVLVAPAGCRDTTGIPADLYRAPDSVAILSAARALMEADKNVALVTLDAAGQPRTRTVNARLTDPDPADSRKAMTVWVLTRSSTRKVEQIRGHPKVTLYFNDDDKITYLSIMGTAVVYDDPADPRVKRFLDDSIRTFFWPDFPRDFLAIEVLPRWLEYLSPALPGHNERWTPQAVVFTQGR